ncbi:hypothetical protein A1O7_05946 [Cladophialophora yegresii CBS 114405]|uniref:REJ domain-containing protein n=1 Tax=Cladophialophora yegresii CBS 114405 TaxID=1182544 RepID=W9W0M2_9EURO|nr:uncharacterized protein A1O7_05946 [Cladophialophora yegresii CBS 114405]EXJ58520.1 hypothetical protein A1O7_05946 [Cladophialophora yegresii CBS 114405]
MHTTQLSLSFLSLALSFLFQVGTAQDTTLSAVSEYPDGQPQAPPTAAVASSSSVPSTSSYENPFTIYTSMTNSLGVITGMPSVVTSQPTQPAVITSQPQSPTLPSYSGYYYNTTSSASVPVSSSPTTLATSMTAVASGTSSSEGSSTGSSSSSSSPAIPQATGGAAALNKITGAGVGLVVAALGFCML